MLPAAGNLTLTQPNIKQTILHLIASIHDGERAGAMVARLVAGHAPELTTWADDQLFRRFKRSFAAPSPAAPPSPEAYFRAMFGVAPTIVETPSSAAANHAALLVDPELGRLAVVLHVAAHFRLWTIGRHLNRSASGSGCIGVNTLTHALPEHGISYSQRHIRRLLDSGEGLFWNRSGNRLFLRGWAYVAAHLSTRAQADRVGKIDRNRPGVKQQYVAIGGSGEAWEAQLYAAWLSYRSTPTIARETLSELFGRDKSTLIRWENERLQHQLTKRKNFAQCHDMQTFFDLIPPHAQSYAARVRRDQRIQVVARVRWQLPNSYQIRGIKEHNRQGQSKKVRRHVNVETDMPASLGEAGSHRIYVDDPNYLKRRARRGVEPDAKYLWLGENRLGDGIYEPNTNGIPETYAMERVRPRDERAFFAARGRNH